MGAGGGGARGANMGLLYYAGNVEGGGLWRGGQVGGETVMVLGSRQYREETGLKVFFFTVGSHTK